MLSFKNSELVQLILSYKKEPNCLFTNLGLDDCFDEIAKKNMKSLLNHKKFNHLCTNSLQISDIEYECGIFLYSKIDKLNIERAKDKRTAINYFVTLSLSFIQQELCCLLKDNPLLPEPVKKEYRCIDESWEESFFSCNAYTSR